MVIRAASDDALAGKCVTPGDHGGAAIVDTVVKIGGALLAHAAHFDAAVAAISTLARAHRLLVVPGGGPFADAVRGVDRRFELTDDAAHWMATLAMDQYAHLLTARLPGGVLITEPVEIDAVIAAGHVPILAPFRWLRATDPLPHTWMVTSDSIAAWVAGRVGAQRLVLIKPPGAAGLELVDSYFLRALPGHVAVLIVPADQVDTVPAVLRHGGIDEA